MGAQLIKLKGEPYVLVEKAEYERLLRIAQSIDMPELPTPDADGNYPALEFADAAIARGVIQDRINAGLTQRELAKRAGIRVETLCRIETGKHLPSVRTLQKIERALGKGNSEK
ncbi:MAG: helix-turn-helix domain-containing protein [Gemmataceae bacterium]|nr:helix-turn-helix domain-containing protein [Gemmataceae bacterium]